MVGLGYFLLFAGVWLLSIFIVMAYVCSSRERENDPVFIWVMFLPIIDTIYAIYLILNIHKIIDLKNLINKLKV